MDEQDKISDLQWLRMQRVEHDRRKWLWARLKSLGGWIVGVLTAMWATVDAVGKLLDWVRR